MLDGWYANREAKSPNDRISAYLARYFGLSSTIIAQYHTHSTSVIARGSVRCSCMFGWGKS